MIDAAFIIVGVVLLLYAHEKDDMLVFGISSVLWFLITAQLLINYTSPYPVISATFAIVSILAFITLVRSDLR